MFTLINLNITRLFLHLLYPSYNGFVAKCNGGWSDRDCCHGQCGQGEGDCDRDSDCLSGLICDFDWWWGDDWCAAGRLTIKL